MTLPASFPISASQINVELGRAANAPFDIQGAAERNLAGVPSGAISFSDFLGKANFTVTEQRASASGGGSPHTYAAMAIGPAAANRWVIVAIALFRNAAVALNISSVTIGGIAASGKDSGSFAAGGPSMGTGLFYANVPSGTTADVVINFANGPVSSSAVIVMTTPGITFAKDFSTTMTPGWTSMNGQIDYPSNGVGVAASAHTTGSGAWSGALGTVVSQAMVSGVLSVAYGNHLTSATNATVGVNWGSAGQGGFEIVSFSQ